MPGLIPGAGPGWETALLVAVPAAEPAAGRHRTRLDAAARHGAPAHITVLYPFLPPAGTGEPALASLGRLFATVAAFEFTRDRVGWFGAHAGGPQALRTAGPVAHHRHLPPRLTPPRPTTSRSCPPPGAHSRTKRWE
jgi:hypothetical protein